MATYKLGPAGKIITGHVLDVAPAPLQRMLRDYDPLLYVKWNAHKRHGHGCWEIRRRPEQKAVVDVVEYKGMSFVRLEYDELDIISHVLDVPYLNYQVLEKLKSMDIANADVSKAYWLDHMDSKAKSLNEEARAKAKAEMLYELKQHRREMQEYKDAVASGLNPAQIADYWK